MVNTVWRDEDRRLAYYSGLNPTDPIEHEWEHARNYLNTVNRFWEMVADHENDLNERLLSLYTGFPDIQMKPASEEPNHRLEDLYRLKVIRHLRFTAKLEALSGVDMAFRFCTDYARYIYPRLLEHSKRRLASTE